MKAILFKVLSKGLLILFVLALYGLYNYRGLLFPQWFEAPIATASTTTTKPAVPESGVAATDAHVQAEESGQAATSPDETVAPQASAVVADEAEGIPEIEPGTVASVAVPGSGPVDGSESMVEQGGIAEAPQQVEGHAGSSAEAESADMPAATRLDDAVDAPRQVTTDGHGAPHGFLPPGVDKPKAAEPPKAATVPAPAPGPVAPVAPTPSVEATSVATAATTPVVSPPTDTSTKGSLAVLLKQARDAYWDGDYATAEQAYEQAIALAGDDPAPYGELGNVYFAQRDLAAAADAYSAAAHRLLTQGRTEEARHLMLVLKGLDEQKAIELHRLIEQSQAPK